MSNRTEYAVFTNEVKASTKKDSRVLSFVGSTEQRDRMGDEIKLSGWNLKNYKKNPVFLWAHDYSQPPLGRAKKVRKDKETNALVFDIEFAPADANPKAEQVYQLYKGGFMKATSVGFMSKKSEPIKDDEDEDTDSKDDDPDNNPDDRKPGVLFKKTELLELSAVPVPANPQALMQAKAKGYAIPEEYQRCIDAYTEKQQSTDNDPTPAIFRLDKDKPDSVKLLTDNDILTFESKQNLLFHLQKEIDDSIDEADREDSELLGQSEIADMDTEKDTAVSDDEDPELPDQKATPVSERSRRRIVKILKRVKRDKRFKFIK